MQSNYKITTDPLRRAIDYRERGEPPSPVPTQGSVRRYSHTGLKTAALLLALTEVWAGPDPSLPPG